MSTRVGRCFLRNLRFYSFSKSKPQVSPGNTTVLNPQLLNLKDLSRKEILLLQQESIHQMWSLFRCLIDLSRALQDFYKLWDLQAWIYDSFPNKAFLMKEDLLSLPLLRLGYYKEIAISSSSYCSAPLSSGSYYQRDTELWDSYNSIPVLHRFFKFSCCSNVDE